MKKRILSTLLTSALVLSMTACGGNAPSEAQSQTSDTSSGTSAVTSDSSTSSADTTSSVPEATTSATTATTAETLPVEPEIDLSLTIEPTMVMDGCMLITADEKYYMYNSTTNELYEYDKALNSDIILISGNIACVSTDYDVNPSYSKKGFDIVNLKTGEVVVSAPKGGEISCYVPAVENTRPNAALHNSLWQDGKELIPIVRVEKNFSGDTISFGAINNKGEWILPMSSDYAICKEENIKKSVRFLNENYIVAGGKTVYDIKNDKIIPLSDKMNDYYQKCLDNNAYYNGASTVGTIKNATGSTINFVGDAFTNEVALITYDCEKDELNYLLDFSYNAKYETESCLYFKYGDKYDKVSYVVDNNFNILNFDLSEYSIMDVFAASEKYVVFSARNEEKDTYKIIMKNDGSFACEPFISNDNNVFIGEDTVVIGNVIIDCITGKTTEISFPIFYYANTAGMMVVYNGQEYGLIDPADPDTLINPFKKAEKIYTLDN